MRFYIEAILADGAIEFGAVPIEGSVDLTDPAEARTFFKRMLLEKQYPVAGRPGMTIWKAPKGLGRTGNEPFDALVYAWALSYGMAQMPGGMRWRRLFVKDTSSRPSVARVPVVRVEPEAEPEQVVEVVAEQEPKRIVVPKNPLSAGRAPPKPGLIRLTTGFRPR